MSTRWYPIYQRGNPQLRVFLPNFWMKLVRPEVDEVPNVVHFHCSMEMTRTDVKNYLQKIYNINVLHVNIRTKLGKTRQEPVKGYVMKDEDVKIAYVTLPRNEVFAFPDLFPEKKKSESDEKALEAQKDSFRNFLAKNQSRPGTPGWFSF